MIITVLFPEMVLIHAMFEFHMAWTALQLMGKEQKSVALPWWSQKLPFPWLPARGRNVDSKDKDPASLQNIDIENQAGTVEEKKSKWTLAHCYFANMGGFAYISGEPRFLITAQQLANEKSPTFANPTIAEEDIKDKSKQDWLAKLLTALQISQLILSIITRRIQGIHFSQLETVTLSFAICGVLIYCAYFYKPQNIDRAMRFKSDAHETALKISLQRSEQPYDSFWAIMLNKQAALNATDSSKPKKAPRIPNDNVPVYRGNNDVHPAVYLLALASGLFGAIHAIAWKFEFPTEEERLLWQIATCISSGSPIVGLIAISLSQFTKAAGDPELFAGNCLRLMQEFSWHASETSQIDKAIEELEDAIAKKKAKGYLEILRGTGENTLIVDLVDFLELKGRFQDLRLESFDLHDDKLFVQDFRSLVNAMYGKEPKRIKDAGWTDAWPRQPLLPRRVNQGILYLTGLLYCASRLILLAVSISSIRKMPGSVYLATDWTGYLPTFGAMGG
jgi:hypothetical protein